MAKAYDRERYKQIIAKVKAANESEEIVNESNINENVFLISQIYRFSDDWASMDDLEEELKNELRKLQLKIEQQTGNKATVVDDVKNGIDDTNKEKSQKAVGQILDYPSLIPVEAFTDQEREAKANSFDKQVVVFLRYLQ